MKQFSLIGSLAASIISANAMASDGRDTNDIMSHFLSTNEQVAQSFMSAASITQASSCHADNLLPLGAGLVFNDTALLKDKFPLSKTLQSIIDTSPHPASSSNNLLVSMLDSLNETEQTNPDSQLTMEVDARTHEANLDVNELLDGSGMIPVGLFNRFDLADAVGGNCGEYRIVYSMDKDQIPGVSGRFFIIFEAAYSNPEPEKGIDGCHAVADFWASLGSGSLSEAQKASQLEDFFYNGVQHNSVSLPPVITFDNYSHLGGQVRTNHFVNSINWQLREFRMVSDGSSAIFGVDTVKDNPLAELYSGNSTNTPANMINTFNDISNEFQNEFVDTYIGNLTQPDSSTTNPMAIINGIALGNENRYNEFQSDAQSNRDIPNPNATFSTQIDSAVAQLSLGLTREHIVNRAGAMTCGGCHQFSNNLLVSPTISWPPSGGFVHIDEQGQLSNALVNAFLPQRAELLSAFVCGDVMSPVLEFSNYINNPGTTGSSTKFYHYDFNGDGSTDYIYHNTSISGGALRVALSNGDGTFQPYINNSGTTGSSTKFYFADFNGDGMVDRVYHNSGVDNGSLRIALSKGDGTFGPNLLASGTTDSSTKFYFHDYNGDGNADYIYHNTGVSGGALRVSLSNGDGTFQPYINNSGTTGSSTKFYFADFNGDGKTDRVYHNTGVQSGNLQIALSNGNGTFGSPFSISGSTSSTTKFYFNDYSGDSIVDYIYHNRSVSNGSLRLSLGSISFQ